MAAVRTAFILEELLAGKNLDENVVESLFTAVMAGEVSPEVIAAILVALRAKGESVAEVSGAAKAMRAASVAVSAPVGAIDMCGTGGDGQHTVNVSTAAALVVAAAGVPVAKHGNRSVSSKSGSADVLEVLGIPINYSAAEVELSLKKEGFAFLFAPNFHPAMKHAIGPRRALGIRTLFNLLGPLTNPASVKRQVIGVFSETWIEPLAEVLGNLGVVHGLVVHSEDGLDEISLSAPTRMAEIVDGTVSVMVFDPTDHGFELVDLDCLRGGDANENASLIMQAFETAKGPVAEWIALNAAAGLRVARDLDWDEAIKLARDVLEGGQVTALVNKLSRS